MTSNHIKIFVFISAVTWALFYGVNWTQEESILLFKPFSGVCTVMGVLLFLFDKYLWKWPVINKFLAGSRRDISGTWELTLVSNWVDPKTNQQIPPKPAYMRVYQTFSSLQMRQMTNESTSDLIGAVMNCRSDGTCEITATYYNKPRAEVRHRSEIHHGAFHLELAGNPVDSIEGSYWTDRGTRGEMNFGSKKSELFNDFKSAAQAFEFTAKEADEKLVNVGKVSNL